MTENIDKIRERIHNLRKRAADAASSENEAETAARMAAELLMKYDIAEEEIGATEESADAASVAGDYHSRTQLHPVQKSCWQAIEALTETKSFRESGTLYFIGMPADVEMALYLSEMLRGAADRGWANDPHWGSCADRKTTMFYRRGFMQGFSARMNERLLEMAQWRQKAEARTSSSGSELVVRKQEIVARAVQQFNIRKGGVTKRRSAAQTTYAAGRAAADRVNLGRPLSSDGETTRRVRR